MSGISLLDIPVAGITIYPPLLALRRVRARVLLAAPALFGFLDLVGLSFGLRLTALLLQVAFAALVITLVVVYHQEIRRFVGRPAAWANWRLRPRRPPAAKREAAMLLRTRWTRPAPGSACCWPSVANTSWRPTSVVASSSSVASARRCSKAALI